MSKWKRRLAEIEQAEREAAKRAHEARVDGLQAALWEAETATLAARYGSDGTATAALEEREKAARGALNAVLT